MNTPMTLTHIGFEWDAQEHFKFAAHYIALPSIGTAELIRERFASIEDIIERAIGADIAKKSPTGKITNDKFEAGFQYTTKTPGTLWLSYQMSVDFGNELKSAIVCSHFSKSEAVLLVYDTILALPDLGRSNQAQQDIAMIDRLRAGDTNGYQRMLLAPR